MGRKKFLIGLICIASLLIAFKRQVEHDMAIPEHWCIHDLHQALSSFFSKTVRS
ncbi:hypothetical protein KF707C_55230 [Metapseudomonas furukawaii]|uniref:Uncharacterized protein n=1 Tax=Metapseudomonas furukawaii TaxID=1149133 RepID=A0AAD1C5W6_METFU|nr:hypothetical protein KF707C_55230 [Pseudomonas furukawaii]